MEKHLLRKCNNIFKLSLNENHSSMPLCLFKGEGEHFIPCKFDNGKMNKVTSPNLSCPSSCSTNA